MCPQQFALTGNKTAETFRSILLSANAKVNLPKLHEKLQREFFMSTSELSEKEISRFFPRDCRAETLK